MGKIKIIVLIVVMYFIYQGMSKIMDSSLDIAKKGQEIEERGEFEREKTVIALMMFLGDPPKMKEHLLMSSSSECLEKKVIAELTSTAIYQCSKIYAVVKGGKIISVIKNKEIITP